MYIILFSNSTMENHLNYIHRGQKSTSMNQLINYKVISKQGGFITLYPIKKALGSGVKKIPLHQNVFYKSLVLVKNKSSICDKFKDLLRCLSYNLLIVKNSEQLMRLLLDDKLLVGVNNKNDPYKIQRIFEVDNIEKFFNTTVTFNELYFAFLNEYIPHSRITNKFKEICDLSKTQHINENDINIINTLHVSYSNKLEKEKNNLRNLSEQCYENLLNKITNWSIPLNEKSDENKLLRINGPDFF